MIQISSLCYLFSSLLLISVNSCSSKQVRQARNSSYETSLLGKFSDKPNDTLAFRSLDFKIQDSVVTNDSGEFDSPVSISEPGYYFLDKLLVYMVPGHDLFVDKITDDSLRFEGQEAMKNAFNVSWKKRFKRISAAIEGMDNTDSVLSILLNCKNEYQAQLSAWANQDTVFYKAQKLHVDYTINQLLMYHSFPSDAEANEAMMKMLEAIKSGNKDSLITITARLQSMNRSYTVRQQQVIDSLKKSSDSHFNSWNAFVLSDAYRENIEMIIKQTVQIQLATTVYANYNLNESFTMEKIKDLQKKTVFPEFDIIRNKIDNPGIKNHLQFAWFCKYANQFAKDLNFVDSMYRHYLSFSESVKPYRTRARQEYERIIELSAGAKAPDFSFTDMEGKRVALKDLAGKYVYIDVWATWCMPCLAELPHFKKLNEEYRSIEQLLFVGLSVDEASDRDKWSAMVRKKEMPGYQLFGGKGMESDLVKALGIVSIPRFILLGPDGTLLDIDAPAPSSQLARKMFNTIISEGR